MKIKISKILGVGLTVALLASLIVAAIPVSAAPLAWSPLPIPSNVNNAIAVATDINDVAVASDGTLFVADNSAVQRLLKSVDGGYAWAPSVFPAGARILEVVLSPNYATDQTLFVHDGALVFRSINGGASFAQLGSPVFAGTEAITSLAVAPDYNAGGVVMIGVAEPAAGLTATNGVWLWGFGGVLAWAQWPAAGTLLEDVTSVAFSPNYPLDATILAVGTSAGGVRLHHCAGTNAWDAIILGGAGPFLVETGVPGAQLVDYIPAAPAVLQCQATGIALPSNYNSTDPTTIRTYVSVVADTAAAPTADNNIYILTGVNPGVAMGAPVVNPAVALSVWYSDLAYSGDFTAGTLFAGNYLFAVGLNANVVRCGNPTASVPLWYGATNRPSGVSAAVQEDTAIALATDFATSSKMYVGTMGVDSAVGNSINGGVTFNETGMIDTPVQAVSPWVADIMPSQNFGSDNTAWLVTVSAAIGTADALMDSLWQTTNGGNQWTRVDWMATALDNGIARLSANYPTDNVVYWAETGAGAVNLLYSADDGNTWSGRISPLAIGDVAAPNATTVYVSLTAGGNVVTSPNAGWTWLPPVATGAAAINDLAELGSDLLVGSAAGTVHHSADGNVTWLPVGAVIGGGGATWVDFDGDFATTSTIFATVIGGNVYRWALGTDTAWTPIDTGGAGASSGIAVADDGTLYQADPTAAAAAVGGVRRSLDPLNPMTPLPPFFEWSGTDGTGAFTGTPLPALATLLAIAEADNTLLCIDRSPADDRVLTITDTLSNASGGVTLIAPANDSIAPTGRGVSFTWTAVVGATNYQLLVASTPDLTVGAVCAPVIPGGGVAAPSTAFGTVLPADTPIYWAVRTFANGPLRSPLGSIWHVEPQLTTAVNAPVPVQPLGLTAVATSVNPVFNWSALRWATNYDFQLAKDSGFTDLLVDESLGNVTSYRYGSALDFATTYYWRVRASSAASTTDWSAGVGFTTMAEPVEAVGPEITVEIPDITVEAPDVTVEIPEAEAAAPLAPTYIWAIIGVGAILVIVVIVLIVRTRRTV